tara:strand:- start:334 stop:492 length:159 start_codon:yes stop_codon:yes gene_type:complete
MSYKTPKNIKISQKHHDILKNYCDDNGFKIYKVVEKWIEMNCVDRKRGLYGE